MKELYTNVNMELIQRIYESNKTRIKAWDERGQEVAVSDRIYTSHIEYLLAENKRLREALERISTFAIVGTVVHGEAMKEIALEALREDEL